MKTKAQFSKKILSTLLAVCLLLSLVPITAMAATVPTDQWSNHAADTFAGGAGIFGITLYDRKRKAAK